MRARSSFRRPLAAAAALTALALIATGCASADAQTGAEAEPTTAAATEVTVTDNHGDITVPVKPTRVVALDNTVMQTLDDWGVELAAAPKGVMGTVWPRYIDDAKVLDVGSHREPNLEAVIEADPDLIIGGYRFASVYDDLKAIQPTIIEINPRDGEDHVSELARQTEILGKVFDREKDASALVDALNAAVADAQSSYDGATVAGLITSGGKINYAAPGDGRGVGSLFGTLGLMPAIDTAGSANHQGDEISVEAIAAANPEWLVVLDRDGAFQEDGYVAAKDLIEQSEALKNVPAVQKGQIVYLDANFYLTEGIQAYTGLYRSLADAFAAAK